MPGKVPDRPAPDQLIDQCTMAVTAKASFGCPAEEDRYVYPQSGDAASGSPPGGNGVPAPRHVTVDPSPIDQTSKVGRATAVIDAPGTEAVADCRPHPLDNHSHVGNLTS